ncbi:MAG: pyruvate,orthophosphate dikinase, partial [Myxococcota bacterium]
MNDDIRFVYAFGEGKATEAPAGTDLNGLLGGKGSNLAEMTRLGLPVPPGFTLTTETCRAFWDAGNQVPDDAQTQVSDALKALEAQMGYTFGDGEAPLLVSVRSGAAASMPGMMDTVLNLGLNDITVEALAIRSGNPRFAFDSYRRLLQMYSNVVMGMKGEILDQLLERKKEGEDVRSDAQLSVEALRQLVDIFKRKIFESTGRSFPQSPEEQLQEAIGAVFRSWNNRRALDYRNANQIPHDIGTAVTVQAMVFGNLGATSATGVAFTRDPNTGAKNFFGEWLPNAQGEDVVSGVRTPQPLNMSSGAFEGDITLDEAQPEAYAELERIRHLLETHYTDMQDIEFTIQEAKLWMLQTRTGKRSAQAEVKLAIDMAEEGLIDRAEAIRRVRTQTLEKLMHPRIDPHATRNIIAQGLGA